MHSPTPTFPWTRRALFLAAPLLFGLVALASGMDANWDLRNYHYYNAWAFLTDRYDRDMIAAQIPTFYNPLLDLPYFVLEQHLPARTLAFLLGALHGLNFILLSLLGEELLSFVTLRLRFPLAAAVAAVGCFGAVALSEVGTVFYDNILSFGYFASLLLVTKFWSRMERSQAAYRLAFLAGFPVGLAFGLKLTSVLFAAGICIALLLVGPGTRMRRLGLAIACGFGVLAGLLTGGGGWMVHLWTHYGNPTFPMFNDLFKSPWGLPSPYRDTQNLLIPPLRRLFFPFFFSFDTHLVGEISFRDFRIAAAYGALPAAALAVLVRGRAGDKAPFWCRPFAFVMVASAIAYGIWLHLFAFYRYIVALEMLAPLLVTGALAMLVDPVRRWRLFLLADGAVLVLLMATTLPGNWIRVPFTAKAVEVSRPAIAVPGRTVVLLAGHEPLSFLLPAFPPEVRFLRIDSTFTNPDQTEVRFNQVMRQQVADHQGPLLALFIPTEEKDVARRIGDYELMLDDQGCQTLTSPIGAAPYALCPVSRHR